MKLADRRNNHSHEMVKRSLVFAALESFATLVPLSPSSRVQSLSAAETGSDKKTHGEVFRSIPNVK